MQKGVTILNEDGAIGDDAQLVTAEYTTSPGAADDVASAASLPALQEQGGIMALIEKVALMPSETQTSVLERLWAMEKDIKASRAEQAFDDAFMAMQEVIPAFKKQGQVYYAVDKNKQDGEKKLAFKFVKMDSIDIVLPPILKKFGFMMTYDSESQANGNTVFVAILRHKGGHTRKTRTPPFPLDTSGGKSNLQGGGSSMSYGQRYATKFALWLKFVDEDDNGMGGAIDEVMAGKIKGLVQESGADTARFLKYMSVQTVEDIRFKDYQKAISMLEEKLSAKQKKEQQLAQATAKK